jgi:ubiquitin carboxyl-terminal hydrolase 5/13
MLFALVDIDAPLESVTATANEASTEQISTLCEMGFSPAQAKKALRETVGKKITGMRR